MLIISCSPFSIASWLIRCGRNIGHFAASSCAMALDAFVKRIRNALRLIDPRHPDTLVSGLSSVLTFCLGKVQN